MTSPSPLPSLDALKAQAKRLRTELEASGNPVSHGQALELIARQYGFRDWNTLHARTGNAPPPPPFTVGQIVEGTYLGQPFIGEVIGLQSQAGGSLYRLTLDFEEPIDVVTFDSFSNFRKRVSCTVDRNGRSPEKTSNGRPQVALSL
ncbi:hypothetical protein HH303_07355 [Rhodospirillaceae bacterium KN72]|uniref:Glyoxalase-related protein domain-containing protein n=1 Tax=Pacificispira spongiicola TaxID=2729598 RepID=A0A7Y0HGF3_9PROT|nr:glyoxalase superfamily protein [Pacificispira spongiicola]NMM44289.1 hypothetical protein [Pacificispira spongiicola]